MDQEPRHVVLPRASVVGGQESVTPLGASLDGAVPEAPNVPAADARRPRLRVDAGSDE